MPSLLHSEGYDIQDLGRCIELQILTLWSKRSELGIKKTIKMEGLNQLTTFIIEGKMEQSVEITQKAIDEKVGPMDIMEFMIEGMQEIGQRFEDGKAFVPNLLMSARAMKAAMELIRPLLKEAGSESKGKVVIGTVKGDLHDIGKNIVASMLEGAGFEIINLGVDVPAQKFAETAKAEGAHIIAISALLTTTMVNMKEVVEACKEAGLEGKVKVMVGGAPLTQEFSDSIGANGYSSNGNAAVRLAKELVA